MFSVDLATRVKVEMYLSTREMRYYSLSDINRYNASLNELQSDKKAQ